MKTDHLKKNNITRRDIYKLIRKHIKITSLHCRGSALCCGQASATLWLVCAETVTIKLNRQLEFSGSFSLSGGGDFSVSKREFPVALVNSCSRTLYVVVNHNHRKQFKKKQYFYQFHGIPGRISEILWNYGRKFST